MLWKRFTLQDTERPPFYTRHSFKGIFERHCKHFQHLYFNGEFKKDFFLLFTNCNVTRTLRYCSNLVILDLPTNFHIKSISFVVNLLHSKELYLEHCINIDDVVTTSVLSCNAYLQALEALSLRMCEQFDSVELITIALSHPSPQIYKIDGCCNLDVLSCIRILNFPRLSLSEFVMTLDLDCHTIEEWNYLENMFGELRLC